MVLRFWIKLIAYLLPFAIPIILFTGFMIYLGEAMPLSMVIEIQQGEAPVLYRPQFGNRDRWYKTLSIEARKPEILAIGSSRVLQMREGMFTNRPDAFYNAGAPAWTLDEVIDVLQELPEDALPEILILGIDHPWFNDAYEGDEFEPVPSDFQHLFAVNRSVMQEVIEERLEGEEAYDWRKMIKRQEPANGGLALGLRAIRDGHGFRNDGSEQYGDFLVARWLYQPTERERHMEWMRRGEEMYVYGDTVSEAAMEDMQALLTWAEDNDITVIGFLPPYMPTLWERMMRRGDHTYIEKLIPRLEALFAAHDFPLFDFSDGAQFGVTDDDFFDGWHGSERVYLRLIARMAEARPDLLGSITDVEMLRQIDASAPDTWHMFR